MITILLLSAAFFSVLEALLLGKLEFAAWWTICCYAFAALFALSAVVNIIIGFVHITRRKRRCLPQSKRSKHRLSRHR